MNDNDLKKVANLVTLIKENDELKKKIDWLFNNCEILYRPPNLDYPLEHKPMYKDMRMFIEGAMKYDLGLSLTKEEFRQCNHPDHNGPQVLHMVIPPEGITFRCPACGYETKIYPSCTNI